MEEPEYFLFGGIAVDLYHEMYFNKFCEKLEEGHIEFMLLSTPCKASDLLDAASSWKEYAQITEDQFNTLKELPIYASKQN